MNPNDFRPQTHPLAMAPTAANRGNTARVCPDGSPVAVVDLRIPPCVWGVVIAISLGITCHEPPDRKPPKIGRPFFAGVRALVTWGIGVAGGFCAEVDWQNGTIIAVPAENLCVSARYVLIGDPSIEVFPADVRAGLAYNGVGGNSNTARLTEPVFLSSNTDVVRIPVPPFAISMTVLPGSDVPLEATVVGRGGMRTPFFAEPLGNHRYSVENALPLPNGSAFVEVRAPSLAAPDEVAAHVVFGLALV